VTDLIKHHQTNDVILVHRDGKQDTTLLEVSPPKCSIFFSFTMYFELKEKAKSQIFAFYYHRNFFNIKLSDLYNW
jgi:hypothetical protein